MTRFARIADGRVAEIITLPDGIAPADAFHADVAASLVACTDTSVVEGATYANGSFGPAPTFVPAVPASVTAAQARIALSRANKLDAVTAAVNAAGGEVLIWFEYATAWERQNAHVIALGAALTPPLSSSDIDGLFTEAATIAA